MVVVVIGVVVVVVLTLKIIQLLPTIIMTLTLECEVSLFTSSFGIASGTDYALHADIVTE